jgi:hypothetical protein
VSVLAPERLAAAAAAAAPARPALPGLLRRHRVFLVVAALGVALRVITQLAYRPALLFTDSWNYLSNLTRLDPAQFDPIGYQAILLRPTLWVGNLATVAALQHVLGLAMGVAIYLALIRNGVRPWLAAVATIPVLLAASQLQIEQNIMSDTLFEALALAGIVTLLWRRPPTARACLAGGLLLGVAVTVRSVGLVMVGPAVIFAALAAPPGRRTRRAVTLGAAFAAPVLAYAAYYSAVSGTVGLNGSGPGTLYARAAGVADCAHLSLPSYERVLCPATPIDQRVGDRYAHDPQLLGRVHPPSGMTAAQVERDFTRRVFEQQPLDTVEAITGDFLQGFSWSRKTSPREVPVSRWEFQLRYPTFPPRDPGPEIAQHGGGGPAVSAPLARFLRDYQHSVGSVPGPLLALAYVVGLAGAAGVERAGGDRRRAACLLGALTGLTLIGASALFEFSWRYQLPSLVFAPLAGALGLTAILGPGRARLAPEPDTEDRAALAAFHHQYGAVQAPVVVVIAAYNEAEALDAVLDELPLRSRDRPVATLVVVDGATDETAAVAAAHGAHIAVTAANRGQGAALRLGYQIARDMGAEVIATTDGDGQYVGTELDALVTPILDGSADFVTGSRWLGTQESADRLRRVGSRVFACLASLLTGQRLTDTSFGFRAMRVTVTASIELHEPQYQSSELLVAAIGSGFRVVERPMTLRLRTAGRTKKGRALRYGLGYARALVGTWWRVRNQEDRGGPVRTESRS